MCEATSPAAMKIERQLRRQIIGPDVGAPMDLGVVKSAVTALTRASPSMAGAARRASRGVHLALAALGARHGVGARGESVLLADARARLRAGHRKLVDEDRGHRSQSYAPR